MTEAFTPADRLFRAAWPHIFVLLQKVLGYYPDLGSYLPRLPALHAAEATPVVDGLIQLARGDNVPEEQIRQWRERLSPEDIAEIEKNYLSDGIVTVSLMRPGYWVYNLDLEGPAAEGSWASTRAQLSLLFQHARQRGIRPFLIFLPHPVQYDPDFIKPLYQRLGVILRPEWYGLPSELQRRLEGFARERDVPYFDPQPSLLAYRGDKARLYFDGGDPHLQPEGNRVVGEAIADWLTRGRLLD